MKIELSFVQRIKLRIFGKVYVGMKKKPDWEGSRPAYVFRCPDHGLGESFTHGFEEILICKECIKYEV